MNRHFILFAIVFAAALSGVAKTFDVDISTGRPAASNEAYYHGETIEFRAVRGRSVVTNVEYSCVYYQTNGMSDAWWHTDGLVFHPTNDVGAASYRFFLEGRDDLGRDWHANGLLRLLPSPGFTPNEIELPVARLDFAAVEVLNPPYYDKAETEAKIVELAPAPGNYAAVSNAAMTAVQVETDPIWEREKDSYAEIEHLQDGTIVVNSAEYANHSDTTFRAESADYADNAGNLDNIPSGDIFAQLNAATTTNALQDTAIAEKQDKLPYPTNAIPYAAISGKPNLATVATSGSYNDLSNKPTIPTVPTNVSAFNNDAGYLTGYTESDPTIKAWAKANTKPTYTASEVGAATAEDVYRIVAGTNVLLIVTNYNSAVHAPLMSLQHLDPDTGEYVVYWNESRRHGITLTNAMEHADAAVAAERERADAAYAPRAWSHTTSGLGAEAPSGVTWISTPETVIAGGYEYEKVVTSAGAVWVLASNGLTAGATTNGYFRIEASDGTELFSIEKTDSYLVGVPADGIARSGNTVTIPLNVVAPSHPYIRAATNIVNAVWTKEDENGFACDFASVSWSGSSGAYVATVTCAEPQAFFYFEFLHEGTSKIRNSAATEMTGGIYFNGTTYMPTVNGNKLEFVAQ